MMKETWYEYKEWLEQILPKRIAKLLWHKHFELALAGFLAVGMVYLFLFFNYGDEAVQAISALLRAL